jgi:hypothetical protein
LRALDVTLDLPFASTSGARSDRHASANEDTGQRGPIALDDLLWLHELRIEQNSAVGASRIPNRVLELFVTRGLVEREAAALRLTSKGLRAVQNLM